MMKFAGSLLLLGFAIGTVRADDDFEKNIRPLLIEHCFQCHGAKKQSGGLRLDSKEAILKGGETGPAAVLGKPDESLLVKALGYKETPQMPPNGKLPDGAIAKLKEWVRKGLPGIEEKKPAEVVVKPAITAEQRKWWSFQPLKPVAVPQNADDKWSCTEIDRFIVAGLKAKGLTPAAPADKRTLLRRATYDLTGLPPTPAEVDAFVKDDKPDAFARAVERLLALPAYGERWGRHWLDVVRYADTAGENSDHPVADAWRYRNWVIDAFNADKPYDEFIREQIAGDIIGAKGPEEKYAARLTATGFLAIARRFDNDPDTAMHLTFEDTIDTLGKAFVGLSISCARCHDHKFDPITANDYYALYGILQSSRFSFPGCEPKAQPRDLVPLLSPAALARRAEQQKKELAALDEELKKIAELRRSATTNKAKQTLLAKGEIPDGGSQAVAMPKGEGVELKVGETLVLSVSPLTNHGADSTLVEWEIAEVDGERKWNLTKEVLADFLGGNPKPDAGGRKDTWAFVDGRAGRRIFAESTRDIQGKPGLHSWGSADTPSVFANTTDKPIEVWTKLPARSVFVHPAPNGNVAVAWVSPFAGKVRVTGRIADVHPGGVDGVGWFLERFPYNLIADLKLSATLAPREAEIAKKKLELTRIETAYAVVEGKPANAKLHLRGDPQKLGPEVPRRWLELLGGQTLPPDSGSGRLHLAGWLSDGANPLTARVMANRVWQYHFGKGLVKTPNDFGTRGQAPTHPELLDWLANQFVKDGWSVKALHRRIMLSAVYQQAVIVSPEASKIDPVNDTYWRFDRRPLSAEELRDSLLTASGQLDRTPGLAHPFPPTNTWGFTQHNPFSTIYDTDKRSIYLTTLRNRRNPFFALFDGPDPNSTTPQRQSTTVPTQALYFLNDPFFHGQAEKVAVKLLATADESARLDELYRIAFQRMPTAKERVTATAFLVTYSASLNDVPAAGRPKVAWSALVRVLLASNEYLTVE